MAQLKDLVVNGKSKMLNDVTIDGSIKANKIIKTNGTNLQILLADGSTVNISDISGKGHRYGESTDSLAEGVNTNYGGLAIASGSRSHAEGISTTASGTASHAEGYGSKATNYYSHAEGEYTTASGYASHAEGYSSYATTTVSHAEGAYTTASGYAAHAEGSSTEATLEGAHAEGIKTHALGKGAHTEGRADDAHDSSIYAIGDGAHAEGYADDGAVVANGKGAHAEGFNTHATAKAAHAEGSLTTASHESSHAEGQETCASEKYAHAEGYQTEATAKSSHAEGDNTIASGMTSHAEGYYTYADGRYSHAEGKESHALSDIAHAEGEKTYAVGKASHAEGSRTYANNQYSHAEGLQTYANGKASHSEGYTAIANGDYSHAEGNDGTASGKGSHAEGYHGTADGDYSHVEGDSTKTDGKGAHAEGNKSEANANYAHAEGKQTKIKAEAGHAEGIGFIPRNTSYNAEVSSITVEETTSSCVTLGNYDIYTKEVYNITGSNFIYGENSSIYSIVSYSNYEIISPDTEYVKYYDVSVKDINVTPEVIVDILDIVPSGNTIELSVSVKKCNVFGVGAHTEGYEALAISKYSHAEGKNTMTRNEAEHAEGLFNKSNNGILTDDIEYVDLGLPSGIMWAKYNLGATCQDTSTSWFGDYYAWGEVETKADYSWATYTRHTNGTYSATNQKVFIKYIPTDQESTYWAGEGSADNKLVLDTTDDVCSIVLGSSYHLPTADQIRELLSNTTQMWVANYDPNKTTHTADDGGISGLNGQVFTSKSNGNQLFIPAAGLCADNAYHEVGSQGRLWSLSLYADEPFNAYLLSFFSFASTTTTASRFCGFNVRPVSTKAVVGRKTIHSVGIGKSIVERKNAFEILDNGNAYLYDAGNYNGTNPEEALCLLDILKNINNKFGEYLPLAGGTMTGAAPVNFTENKIDIDFRPGSSSYYSRVGYRTSGNEALVFANTNPVTSFIFKCGYTLTSGTSNWSSSVVGVPNLQMKNQSVYVNKAIDDGVTPTHNFAVSGTSRFEGTVNVTNAAANNGCVMSYDPTERCMKFSFS